MRDFMRFLRHGFIVIFAGAVRIKTKIELVFPTEFETRFRQGVVACLRAGVA